MELLALAFALFIIWFVVRLQRRIRLHFLRRQWRAITPRTYEIDHLGLLLHVSEHTAPAGPWQVWKWTVSRPESRRDGFTHSHLTIGGAASLKEAMNRAIRCADNIAEHPHTPTPPIP